jgi:serine/threonine protein kinase
MGAARRGAAEAGGGGVAPGLTVPQAVGSVVPRRGGVILSDSLFFIFSVAPVAPSRCSASAFLPPLSPPQNVLLDAEGHVRLSDFGLAGDLNVEADAMTVGACGTTGYMAQELLANMRYDTTPDLFAFGVLIFEMLVRACSSSSSSSTGETRTGRP